MDITKLKLNPSQHILVTGGAGFIGSNLCEALISNGNSVTCLDNFVTGKRENIADLLSNPNFSLIEGIFEIWKIFIKHKFCR